MRVLVTSPEIDSLTRYLHVWANRLIEECSREHTFIQLDGKKATRKRVHGILEKKNIDVALLNGHGSDSCIMGHNEIIIDENNANLLSDKVVHALSCHTAKTLGPVAKSNGAKTYVGYKEKFVALLQSDKTNHPEDDDTAALFLNPAFAVQKALLSGKSGEDSVEIGRKAYNRSILEALNSDVQSDNDQFIDWLLWDRDNLVSC